MGLLETLMARLDRVEKHLNLTADQPAAPAKSGLQTAAEVTALVLGEPLPTAPTAPVAPVAAAPAAEQLVDKFGVVWHADHHASTKSQNNDGSWKAKKGGDKAARESYEAQFKHGISVEDITKAEINAGNLPATPATPSVPATPAAPTAPVVPAKPATPTVPTAPAEQIEATKYIQQLTNTWKVPYQAIVDSLLAPHGVDTFQNLPVAAFATVRDAASNWLEKLNELDAAIETLATIDEKTAAVHSLPASVKLLLEQNTGVSTLQEIPHDKLTATADVIGKFASDWKAWAEASGIAL